MSIPSASTVLPILAAIVGVVATIIGLRSASITIRDSIDDFMADVARQGRWSTSAAIGGCIAAVLTAVATIHREG